MKGLKRIAPGVYDAGKYLIIRTTDLVDRYKKKKNGWAKRPFFVHVTYWSVYIKNVKSKPVYRGLTIPDCMSMIKSAS